MSCTGPDTLLDLPRWQRSQLADLLSLRLPDARGQTMVPLGELVRVESTLEDESIYHKNLLPVVYVTGNVAAGAESPAYAIFAMNEAIAALGEPVAIYDSSQRPNDARPAIKWDGEWDITLELFRDLGGALGVVLVLIYALLVGWFRSFVTPLVVMAAIPFSLIGILPAHAALGAFFTATSMIGFMAGAGIVVRNSIILVGSAVILFDPIFQGLAISLAAGEVASLLISRVAVPVLYAMAWRRRAPVVSPVRALAA